MKDPRFLPVERREPVEEYDDDFLESDESELCEMLSAGGKGRTSVRKLNLYIAS